ncbi:hypothetical protein, partial [Acinetobacter baumannii]
DSADVSFIDDDSEDTPDENQNP